MPEHAETVQMARSQESAKVSGPGNIICRVHDMTENGNFTDWKYNVNRGRETVSANTPQDRSQDHFWDAAPSQASRTTPVPAAGD